LLYFWLFFLVIIGGIHAMQVKLNELNHMVNDVICTALEMEETYHDGSND